MELSEIKLVTVVADEGLKDELIEIFESSKITGYTYFEAFGRGEHHDQKNESEPTKNIKFKILLSELVSLSLMRVLAKRFFARGGIILFQQDAMIIRPEKFQKVWKDSVKEP